MRKLVAPQRWNLDYTLLGLALVILVSTALLIQPQSDTWWLLRIGSDTLATGAPVTTDTHSFTIANQPWDNHEWLAEVLFYGVYSALGLAGLIGLCALLMYALWGMLGSLLTGPGRVKGLLILLGLFMMVRGWSMRPQLFSMVLLALSLWLLNKPRLIWAYPLVFWLWANLHAGFAAGAFVLGSACAVALWRYRSTALRWLGISLGAAALTLVNPLGVGLWRFAFIRSVDRSTFSGLSEWQAPSFTSVSGLVFLAVAIWLYATIWRLRHKFQTHYEWTMALSSIVLSLVAVRTERHISLFIIAALPVLSWQFRAWQPLPPAAAFQGRMYQVLTVAMAVCGLALVFTMPRPAPLEAASIAAVEACPGPLYNTFGDGGPLLWFAPAVPVMIDNRYDPYPQDLFNAVNAAEEGRGYAALFDQYAIRCALLPVDAPLAAQLQAAGWQQASSTPLHTVWYQQ